jgi:hypothetical protein
MGFLNLRSEVTIQAETLFKSIAAKVPSIEGEFESIAHCFKFETIRKKEKLIIEGHNAGKIFFIQIGLLVSYKTLDSGDTQWSVCENFWMGDLNGFIKAQKRCLPLRH